MTEFELLPAARLEHVNAFQWYADQSPAAAERFVTEFEAAIEAIRRNPDRYPRWDDDYRFYLVQKFAYFIAYRQVKNLVVVVTIRHASQDQDAWKGR